MTTTTFSSGSNTWTVPSNLLSSITVDMAGASGGTSNVSTAVGGNGGRIQFTLSNVSSGDTLHVYVGGAGANSPSGSVGGGGSAFSAGGMTVPDTGNSNAGSGGSDLNTNGRGGGGGGGASSIYDATLGTLIAIAGGGGGGGGGISTATGGAGGQNGSNAAANSSTSNIAGGGATQAGGPGTPTSSSTGNVGLNSGPGGSGSNSTTGGWGGGGGGGSGYYGGGGGGGGSSATYSSEYGSGGGGGSSYVAIGVPSFVSYATAGSTTSPITCNVPTGTSNGDYMIAFCQTGSTSGAVTPPTGWTQLDQPSSAGSDMSTFYRVASSEPSSYSWSFASNGVAVSVLTYRNVTGIDVHTATNGIGSGSFSVGPVTTTHANEMVVVGFGSYNLSQTYSTPTGYNSIMTTATGATMDLFGAIQASAGSTGTITTTTSGSLNDGAAIVTLYSTATARASSITYTSGYQSGAGYVSFTYTADSTPTITPSAPTNGAFLTTLTPLLLVQVTDADPADNDSVTFTIATDSGFTQNVATHTTSTLGTPLSLTSFGYTFPSLQSGTKYFWKAQVNTGDGLATATTSTSSFTIFSTGRRMDLNNAIKGWRGRGIFKIFS